MKNTEYAIVDIETTGGNASGSRITEIAIIIHDGTAVIDRWETLVNPQKEIPLPIFALTGINNQMVSGAPIFDDIAEKVADMLTDRIATTDGWWLVRNAAEQIGDGYSSQAMTVWNADGAPVMASRQNIAVFG